MAGIIPKNPILAIVTIAPSAIAASSPAAVAVTYCFGVPRARACSETREQEGHFIPTGVSRMQAVQIGWPHAAQDTRVSRRGWWTQCRTDCAMLLRVSRGGVSLLPPWGQTAGPACGVCFRAGNSRGVEGVTQGMESDHRKVIIIGSGPAGLTAALYWARANLAPL